MKVITSIIITLTLLSGCASVPPKTASERVFTPLQGEKVIANVYFANETLLYMNEGFMHEKHREANFGAVLDVKEAATELLSKQLNSAGLVATSIYQILDKKNVQLFINDERKGLSGKEKNTSKWSQSDINDWHGYHKSIANIPLEKAYSKQLLQSDNRYLVEFIFSPQLRAAKTAGTDFGVITSTGYIRVVDLELNRIHYTGAIFSNMSVELTQDSLKQSVESNNLQVIRQFIDHTLENVLAIPVGDI